MKYHQIHSRRASSGFSMIEVLVTTVVLALGILGTSALQIIGLKGTDAAHYRTVATFIANETAERIRMNPEGVTSGDYETDTTLPISCTPIATDTLDCRAEACTPSQLASFDLTQLTCGHVTKLATINSWTNSAKNQWNQAKKTGVINSLPNGSLTIDCGGSGCGSGTNHNITVSWAERADNDQQISLITNVVISILP